MALHKVYLCYGISEREGEREVGGGGKGGNDGQPCLSFGCTVDGIARMTTFAMESSKQEREGR